MRAIHTAHRIRMALIVLCLLTLALALFAFWLDQQHARVPQYLLRDDGGRLAVYSADGLQELTRYDILTRLLPENDMETLRAGLPVYSDAELARLVEDYGG